MSEDPARPPVETAEEAIGRLARELEDLRTSIAARLLRRPTGDLEPTLRAAAKPDTLLCNGQAVSRTTYAMLFAWATEQNLFRAGLFGTGDGSTTFTLPDFRGRVPRTIVGTEQTGVQLGTDSVTLTVNQMPSHGHSVSINGVGDHDHFIAFSGAHRGHNYSGTVQSGGPLPYGTESDGNHNHAMNWNGNHNHGVNQSNAGGGQPFDNKQASFGINWLIWT